jgi:hypothetical protein
MRSKPPRTLDPIVDNTTLSTLFNNAVGCFEHVRLDHSFDTDGWCSLRLDLATLRLSRWGKAVGLSNNPEDTQLLQDKTCVNKATRALKEILELFDTTKKISAKSKRYVELDTHKPAVTGVHANGDPSVQSLHKKMQQLSIERLGQLPTSDKAEWTIYEKKYFNRLLEDITEQLRALPDVSENAKKEQLKLCELEVSGIESKTLLVLLRIAEGIDEDFEAAARRVVVSKIDIPNIW